MSGVLQNKSFNSLNRSCINLVTFVTVLIYQQIHVM